jgi:ferrochelatase
VARELRWPTTFVPSYPSQKGFVEAIAELTSPLYEKAKQFGVPRVLLTAHGLPEKIIKKGDPYQKQVETTARDFVEKMGLPKKETVLCYQSRVGPLRWIGPSLEEEVIKASQEKRPLVVVPISFVSEHSETLVELDITTQNLALEKGCPAYFRVKTVQTHPLFIQGLAFLVKRSLTNQIRHPGI